MEKEYLPIGTVCTLYGSSVKAMIIGYFAIEYDVNVKIFMYNAVPYPKGTSASKNRYLFNEDDIQKVEFLGFKNDEFDEFNKKLSSMKMEKIKTVFNELNVLKKTMNFVFDEDGFVIAENYEQDDSSSSDSPLISSSNDRSENAYTPVSKEPVENKSLFNELDKDGFVIKEENNNQVLTQKLEDNGTIIGGGDKIAAYKFDENGVVIGVVGDEENSEPDEKVAESTGTTTYEFDQDGFVVEEK